MVGREPTFFFADIERVKHVIEVMTKVLGLLLAIAVGVLVVWIVWPQTEAVPLLVGSVSQNLQQALLLSFFSIFPLIVISGTLLPVENMPQPVQLLSLLSPLRYYHEIRLGISLKGVGWQILWSNALAMGSIGVGIFACGMWRFRRRIG